MDGDGGGGSGAITKARNDEREYRRVVLQNQLQALLISHPHTDKAAAAMDVHVGYFSDPQGLQGLAHFLEHMLFYASAKYPSENSYMKFLTEHGGHSNAFTSSEHTNFHFDVNADHFEEALDRFAQFFICPLMSEEATSREINAVDSENKKNLTMDAWRLNQLCRHTCSKKHPYSNFGTGNLETLDVRPKARGVDTHEELLKFYESHYSSNLMCLVVYGKVSLDKLQSMTEEKFSAIKNTMKNRPWFKGQPCSHEDLQLLVKAVPVKEKHSVSLSWQIPPETRNYKVGPSRYLGHLLGHEAEGSLFALLKRLGLATSLSAGERERSLQYAFFTVDIELTDRGQSQVEAIFDLTFQYIKILQKHGVTDWIFEEVKAVCDAKFHFQDKIPPINYATYLAGNMQLYPSQDWLVGSSLPCDFNPGIIKGVLDLLTPDAVRIIWASKEFEGNIQEQEPWYGTSYSVEKISNDLLKQWSIAVPDGRLHLPSLNPFIATDFSLKGLDYKTLHPVLLKTSEMSRLWYKPDSVFHTPKACIMMHFNCPVTNSSPEADVLTDIFLKLLVDSLNEYAYYAEIAGINYYVGQTGSGFQVSLSGYNQKLAVLLEKIVRTLVGFEVKEDRFLVIKEKVLRECLNFRFEQPYQQALYYCSLLLEQRKWHISDCIEVLPELEAGDLTSFLSHVLSRTFIECYVAGNFTSEEAQMLVKNTEKVLSEGPIVKTRPVFPSQRMEHRIVKLDMGDNYYYAAAGLNPQDENSSVHIYFQVGQDETLQNILLELFILSAKQDLFHQLRTVEQLGYIVALVNRNDFGVRGAQIIIQSTVKDPKALDSRVEAFLESFQQSLQEMTEEEFQINVNALIEMKLEKYKNLREESRFYWREIEDGTLKFNRRQIEVAALQKVTKSDLMAFFNENFKMNARKRRKISVQVHGSFHLDEIKCVNADVGQNLELQDYSHEELAKGISNAKLDIANGVSAVDGAHMQEIRIIDIFNFKRSKSLFASIK